MFCSHTQKGVISSQLCVYMCAYTRVCTYMGMCSRVYTCMCPCVCGLTPPLHLAPTLVCLLFHHVLPSKVILLSCVSPQAQGRQPPLSCSPHVAFFAQGWMYSGVWEGPPQVLINDLWLRVQPAMSFRAVLGGRGPLGEDPKTEFHLTHLARNHAALVLHSDGTHCGDPGLLILSPLSRAASSSPHRTALLQARPRLLLPVQSLVCLAAFGLALPLAISLFPQMSEVSEGSG